MEARRQELDKIRIRFAQIEPNVVLKPELDSTLGEVQRVCKKLADENISQQFELNVLNNFVDKYAPIRVQYQISSIMRKIFYQLDNLDDLFKRYEVAESAKFQELHQILFMDSGKADIVEAIEKMNLGVAGQ